jgi:sugar phosphate isomerase/epimerase
MTDLDQEESLRKIGKNLKATHIHDNFKNDDQHLIPGIGICNWKSVMPILKEIGYEGPLMLELVYPDDSTLSAVFKHRFASIERLQALMEGKI